MTMNARSAKDKGRRFEQHLLSVIRAEVDSNAHRTPGSGAGLDKNDIRIPSLNLEIEAKNTARTSLLTDWEQTKSQRTLGNKAVLAIRRPDRAEFVETLIVMDFEDFIDLLKNQGGARTVEVEKGDSREKRYKIEQAVRSLKTLLKEYE